MDIADFILKNRRDALMMLIDYLSMRDPNPDKDVEAIKAGLYRCKPNYNSDARWAIHDMTRWAIDIATHCFDPDLLTQAELPWDIPYMTEDTLAKKNALPSTEWLTSVGAPSNNEWLTQMINCIQLSRVVGNVSSTVSQRFGLYMEHTEGDGFASIYDDNYTTYSEAKAEAFSEYNRRVHTEQVYGDVELNNFTDATITGDEDEDFGYSVNRAYGTVHSEYSGGRLYSWIAFKRTPYDNTYSYASWDFTHPPIDQAKPKRFVFYRFMQGVQMGANGTGFSYTIKPEDYFMEVTESELRSFASPPSDTICARGYEGWLLYLLDRGEII